MAATPPQPLSGTDRDRMYRAAEILLRARRELMPVADLPEELRPTTLQEAYALQDILGLALSPIAGWKIGAPAPDAAPLYAPMPAWGGYIPSGGRLSRDLRRMRGVEAEIAFLIGKDLPPRSQDYTREEIIGAIASAHPAIELLESAFLDPDQATRLAVIGDLQMNGGFAWGPAVPDWQSIDLRKESVTVSVDAEIRFEGTASNTAGTDLLRLVVFLANEGAARTGGLREGDWVTTGSWSGIALVSPGQSVRVRFSHFGEVDVFFE
jgi:2-keto-4-pentenoate hydratase